MAKIINLVIIILMLTSCSATSTNLSVNEILPREGYVFIKKIVILRKCEVKRGVTSCVNGRVASAGSGFIVKTTFKGSFIMTASHVCVTNKAKLSSGVTATDMLQVETLEGKLYDATVLSHDPDIDACLMFADNLVTGSEEVNLSDTAPVPGDKVYNIASPYGMHYPNVVPIFEGRYIGEREHKGFYTFGAGPGSSGSMILNENGELIGLLHSVYRQMHEIVVSVDYDSLMQFIRRGLIEHSTSHHRQINDWNRFSSNKVMF